ncbi:MAG: hypothetical protein GYB67_17935 [Chloroflexi bacterium]|nr:hypothetical protein [Chloroflexota bacterium]
MFKKFVTITMLIAVIAVLSVSAAGAQSGFYLNINSGSINVTTNEQPHVVVQFGNRSGAPANVGIFCLASKLPSNTDPDGFVRLGNIQSGPFGSNIFAGPDGVFFGTPDALADGTINLINGQNHNVSFQLRFENESPGRDKYGVVCELYTVDGFNFQLVSSSFVVVHLR